MSIGYRLVVLALLVSLAACSKDPPAVEKTVVAAPAAAPAQPFRDVPDFGGVKTVTREAEGIGSTAELAVLSAIQSAVAQVNGMRVANTLQTVRSGLAVTVDGQSSSMQAEAFTARTIAASGGSVLGYRIVSQQEVSVVDSEVITRVRASDGGGSYKASASSSGDASASARAGDANAQASSSYEQEASVEANRGASSYELDNHYKTMRSYWKVKVAVDVAQYKAAKEEGRPKIVVVEPRTLSGTYAVGDDQVGSDEVARAIRARLSDTLTQTKRFIVLDREFQDEMRKEIEHINSGEVRAIDAARIGQQLATDLILIPTIERFEYPRSVRNLRMSSRQVVSYSGGGRLTLRLVNASTGEVVMSESFEHNLSPTGPSTLPRVVNGKILADSLMDELSGRMGKSIVAEIFPISVVALVGNRVVLSQGGDAVAVGERYDAVNLGEELIDPQTGNSLGRMELPCCVVRIERVERQTAYGVIDDSATVPPKAGFVPGSIRLTRLLAESAAQAAAPVAQHVSGGAPTATPVRRQAKAAAAEPASAPAEDGDW